MSTLRKIKNKEFNAEELARLEALELRMKRRGEDFEKISEVRDAIDDILFIPEIISVHVENIAHYKRIIKDGLFINDKRYVRLLSGAGNLRRNTVIFIEESYFDRVVQIFDNDRDLSVELNPAKFNAYFGLYNSSGIETIFPNIVVIPDYEFEKEVAIDWVDEGNHIHKEVKNVTLNAFDGQGIVAYHMASRWAEDLGLDYVPSTFIFRAPFAKGQLVTFPIDEFIRAHESSTVVDIWGNEQDLRFADVILSESQLKLWQSYSDVMAYVSACYRNKLGFFITRVSPKDPSSYTTSNYMFINALELETDADIEELCADTIAHINEVSGMSIQKMKLYLAGKMFDTHMKQEDFWKLNPMVRALMINEDIAQDPHVISTIISALRETIKRAYLGKLFVEGNYAPLVADPYAQMEWAIGKNPVGLLAGDEHYYKFWNMRGIKRVACGRSPLTHPSEMIVTEMVNRKELDQWYKYQSTSFILPIDSVDTILMADSDYDGDMAFSTSDPVFIRSKQEDASPISYDKRLATKKPVDTATLWESDVSGFFSKVGFITNVSSTFHTMKYMYEEGSVEREELDRRLKLLRMYQGEEIDGAKNADDSMKRVIPYYWVKWQKEPPVEYFNDIIADKRPAYMRWLYKHYDKDFRRELSIFDVLSIGDFDLSMNDLLLMRETDRSPEQQELVDRFVDSSNFLHVSSPMNKVSKHIQREIKAGRYDIRKASAVEYDYRVLLSKNYGEVDNDKIQKMLAIATDYGAIRRSFRDTDGNRKFKNSDQIIVHVRDRAYRDVSSSGTELADLAVIVCYGIKNHSKAFLWNVFGEELVFNLLERYGNSGLCALRKYPLGDVDYLYSKYETYDFEVEI